MTEPKLTEAQRALGVQMGSHSDATLWFRESVVARMIAEAKQTARAEVEVALAESRQWLDLGPGHSTSEQVEAFEKGVRLVIAKVETAMEATP